MCVAIFVYRVTVCLSQTEWKWLNVHAMCSSWDVSLRVERQYHIHIVASQESSMLLNVYNICCCQTKCSVTYCKPVCILLLHTAYCVHVDVFFCCFVFSHNIGATWFKSFQNKNDCIPNFFTSSTRSIAQPFKHRSLFVWDTKHLGTLFISCPRAMYVTIACLQKKMWKYVLVSLFNLHKC